MKKDETLKYQILFSVFFLQEQIKKPVSLDMIIDHSREDPRIINLLVPWMASKHWVDDLNGAWLIKSKDGYSISGVKRSHDDSTGGYRAMEEAQMHPQFDLSLQSFKDEVLSGTTSRGYQTLIENAVLPKGLRHVNPRRTPEDKFHAANKRLMGREFEAGYDDADDLKRCPKCGEMKKRKPSDEWSRGASYCKQCERDRRKKK